MNAIGKKTRFTILSIFVYSFNNIVNLKGAFSSTQVTIQAGKQVKTSKIISETPHPNFDESFVFLLNEELEEIIILIKDAETGSEIGKIILILGNLAEIPIQKKILPVHEEKSNMTATISATVKYC